MEIAVTVISILLAIAFVGAGGTKLLNMQTHVESFQRWGYPPWFRVVIGIVEVTAAALLAGLWVEWLTIAGGLVIGGVMLGAVYTHTVRASEIDQIAAPVILGALAAAVIALRVALVAA